jgi:hypothetical protein
MRIKYGNQDETIIDFIKRVIEERDAVLHDINRKVRLDFIFEASFNSLLY